MSHNLTSVVATRIIDGIKDLWTSRSLADVTLKADDKTFPVHKMILALSSDYFMAMFTMGMVESTSNVVELKAVTAQGLEPLLQYIYTGHLPLTQDNVCDVIMAASHLQMDSVLSYCSDRLNNVIRTDNCVDLKNIAKLYSLEEIEYIAEDFILDNFEKVMKEGSHCKLDLRALLLCYYQERTDNSDAILLGPEKKVFDLLMDWIKYGEDDRMADIARVMDVVRFHLMSLKEIDEAIQEVPRLTSDTTCNRLIDEAKTYHNLPVNQRVISTMKKTRLRNNQSIFSMNIGPKGHPQIYALSLGGAFNPNARRAKAKWMHICDIEETVPDVSIKRDVTKSIVINDFLFLTGISDSDSRDEELPRSCYIFDPRFLTWTKIASLNIGRFQTTLVFHDRFLYVLGGGLSIKDQTNTESVERYNFETDTWEECGTLRDKLRNHGACLTGDTILITGGRRQNGLSTNQIQLFDLKTLKGIPGTSSPFYPIPSPHEGLKLYNILDTMYAVDSNEGVIKTYQEDSHTWKKFWVRMGGPKIPENGQCTIVGTNLVFVNGLLESNDSESDSDDSDYQRHPFIEHACVEVIIGDLQQGAGKVFKLEEYPSGLGEPVLLAGLRLPWEITNCAFGQ